MKQPQTFALYFGNRGFFPESLIAGARREMKEAVERSGHHALLLDEGETRFGAVESVEEGRKYARFLEQHKGRYDGVVLCLPNFGDETGAIAALEDCGVPILIQAYPDELDKMGFSRRRDAFCGKFSIMDVFYQYGLPYTILEPHTVHPTTPAFDQHLQQFAALCRIVRGMKRMTIGAIGARTTAFKTVRFDELTLQRYGITTETLDMSEVFLRFKSVDTAAEPYKAKLERLKNYTCWDGVPSEAVTKMAKLGIVIDDIIAEFKMDAIAFRCWLELEKELKIAPCTLLSEINDRGIAAACEVDVCNAVMMRALSLASERPATCLDWNNNYGDNPDKCILFHCGPVPQSLMTTKGQVVDHPMFAKALGCGCGWGPNVGRIAASPMTYASAKTENGKLCVYTGQGEMTADPIAKEFFGCAGVAHIPRLQSKLRTIGRAGYRHHVSMTFGQYETPINEAFSTYLGYDFTALES
jgi:L-fucose isomerase-like protein